MNAWNIENRVFELIAPIAPEEGLELWDVVLTFDQGQRILRVMIDKAGGVNVDDCSRFSRAIEDLLEVKAVISGRYSLEVSSPGLDRPLKQNWHFKQFIGDCIQVRTKEALEGRRNFKGRLLRADDQGITVEVDGDPHVIPYQEVGQAKREWSPLTNKG